MRELRISAREIGARSQPVAALGDAAAFRRPEDVLNDPRLAVAEKKAILASWCSDARSVENVPDLRVLDNGAVVEVDAILRALISLDGPDAGPRRRARWSRPPPKRRGVFSRWSARAGWPNRANDDDDEPPPAPAGLAVPFRPTFVSAHGAPPEGLRGLACAAV
jgi:hypothetical protein